MRRGRSPRLQGGAGAPARSTIYATSSTSSSGSLDDTATVAGSDGFVADADASASINASAVVWLTINERPSGCGDGDVHVLDAGNVVVASPTVTFDAGDNTKSVTVNAIDGRALARVRAGSVTSN